jgi:polysaccharide pyruvyl transferase WcaK-like protein
VNRIVLTGYYGFGNFGDDILMLTAYNIARDIFPKAEIVISSESRNANYIHELLPNTKIINSSNDFTADLTIHGGGGVFFDFKEGRKSKAIVNHVIKIIGYRNFVSVYRRYQKIKGQGFLKTTQRAGLGIGVGTYTKTSSKFLYDILSLADFDFLLVRDKASLVNARAFNSHATIHQSSDLAFLPEKWNPNEIKRQQSKGIGFVLRDWKTNDHVNVLCEASKILKNEGTAVKFFSFDKSADKNYIDKVSSFGSISVWDPGRLTIDEFLSEISSCSIVVSSRAHGAIVSACLGIPVICVAIEPKLLQVREMLKDSAMLMNEQFTVDEAVQLIREKNSSLETSFSLVKNDVKRNRNVVIDGLNFFRTFISEQR